MLVHRAWICRTSILRKTAMHKHLSNNLSQEYFYSQVIRVEIIVPLRKLVQRYRDFLCCKNENFQYIYFFHIFLIFAQNIDYGYTLEPPCHNPCFGAKMIKMNTPAYMYQKVGFAGVYISQTCFPDGSFRKY